MKKRFMMRAIELAVRSAEQGTGPFGCVIVKNSTIIAEGWNQVTKHNDPTAHAEIQAIRNATKHLRHFELTGCDVYASGYPCPMCLGALYWARPKRIFYATTARQAAAHGFDDAFIYDDLKRPNNRRRYRLERISLPEARRAFEVWETQPENVHY